MRDDRGGNRHGRPSPHPGYERHHRPPRPNGEPAPPIHLKAGTGPKPVAVVPDAMPGTRTLAVASTTIIATDYSGSVASTDPDNARIHDARYSMAWAEKNMGPDDRFILINFTDNANSTGLLTATEAKNTIQAGEPRAAGGGGTAYLPVALHAIRLVADADYAHLVLVTDGMSGDVGAFAATVAHASLRTTLVPFGSDWPFIKTNWEPAQHIRLAAHVSDQPLAIARALAHTMLELTGQAPRPHRRRRTPRRLRSRSRRGRGVRKTDA